MSLQSLSVDNNASLVSLTGLSNVTSLLSMYVRDNPKLPACAVTRLEAQTGATCDDSCTGNTGTGSCRR
jgi:hypothetical protein